MALKYTKWPYNTPNVRKTYQHLPLHDPQKLTQVGIFGLKIFHLATLLWKTAPSLYTQKRALPLLTNIPPKHSDTYVRNNFRISRPM
jgi:hypothetical protein